MKQTTVINKSQWLKQGFVFQLTQNRFLLGSGPFHCTRSPISSAWSLFYSSFFSSGIWRIASAVKSYSRQELEQFLKKYLKKTKLSLSLKKQQWLQPDVSQFNDFFSKTLKKIHNNKLQKAVPVLFETCDYKLQKQDILILLKHLLVFSEGRAYAFWDKRQTVIGNSPELLFQQKGMTVKTMAVAGTARSTAHNLLKDTKELWEQKLVVEDIKSVLEKHGNLKISKTKLHSVGKLKHLRTDISLKLKKTLSFQKLCRLLHPTAAVGGLPRRIAFKLLKDFHKTYLPRYGYGAPFGVCRKDQGVFVPALRNIQFIKNKAFIGSGCGLVKGSKLKQEWKELEKKRQFIKKILRLI